MIAFLLWMLLLAVCWPLAIAALVLYPLAWILLLPFRVVGISVGGVLALLRAMFMLPVRLLGGPGAVRRSQDSVHRRAA
jgi:uncharacterized membrane protein YgaE (UPF0421/DUF939 family)